MPSSYLLSGTMCILPNFQHHGLAYDFAFPLVLLDHKNMSQHLEILFFFINNIQCIISPRSTGLEIATLTQFTTWRHILIKTTLRSFSNLSVWTMLHSWSLRVGHQAKGLDYCCSAHQLFKFTSSLLVHYKLKSLD